MRVLSVILLGALALAPAGCAKDYVTGNEGDVIFRVVDVNGGAQLDSDVVDDEGSVFNDEVTVTVAVRPKNPLVEVPQIAMAVFLERYEVRYVRSDGRNTPGVDVPYPISGGVTTVIDAADSGDTVGVPIEVVRHTAKREPPLANLQVGSGLRVVSVMAEITLYGKTTAGHVVSDKGFLQITFANFGG
jgi:hypothetical protein